MQRGRGSDAYVYVMWLTFCLLGRWGRVSAHLVGMTDQTRPLSRFAAFEQKWRRKARTTGEPIERLLMPAVLFPAISRQDPRYSTPAYRFVSRKNGRLLAADLLADRPRPTPLDFEALVEAFYSKNTTEGEKTAAQWTPGGVIIVPDRPTADFLMRKAEHSEGAGPLASSLALADALPASTRFVVLTEALTRKFFLPTGLDEDRLEDWMEAFGMRRARTFANLRRLLVMVYRGRGGLSVEDHELPESEPAMSAVARPVAVNESYLMGTSRSRSLEGQCSQFSDVTAITNRWGFLVESDPLGRRMAELDGRVFTAEATDTWNRLRVTTPFVAREGKQVMVLPPDRIVSGRDLKDSLRVEAVSVEPNGQTYLSLSGIGVLPPNVTQWQFCQVPFMPSFMGSAGKRWTSQESDASTSRPVRQVPLAITLAGAPTAATKAA